MRILVYGAGVQGSLYGARLISSVAGHLAPNHHVDNGIQSAGRGDSCLY
jgi:ketopantoate reductase